jgi:AP-4 complex subunit epsilon-1
LEPASKAISKFFASDINNLKYLGISAIKLFLAIDPQFANDYQIIVVECLESSDETLKRETLELLYKMTNQDNIEFIIHKLMEQLKNNTDPFFKKDMVNKVGFLFRF